MKPMILLFYSIKGDKKRAKKGGGGINFELD